ncbi:hemicentin-2-like [Mytilus trossulus]|uniref:hemicentin-2-like n=1 Tax=Mytilus trossulus TaxID=6551 RepID=UPI00300647F2
MVARDPEDCSTEEAGGIQHVSPLTQTIFVKEGATAKLLCPQRTETISTTWTGPVSENPIADGRQISYFFKAGKFSVTGNFSSGESILLINTVTSDDQGDYTCDIVVDGMPLQHTVRLILEQPPTQMMISGLDNFGRKHGQEGQRIALTCTVESGQPEETMLWTRNGTVVKVGGPRILRFDWIATRSDNLLNYTCTANNSATNDPLMKTVQLDIAYTPVLSANGSKEIQHFEGQSLYVTCDQSSNPPSSEPKWWHVDVMSIKRLFSNSRILYINVITRRDTGIYICEAANTIGTGSTNISINVLYPPTVRIDYNNYTENENRRELLCVANGNPDKYTFSQWDQKSQFGEHIRFIDGYTNGSLVLPATPTKSYQDAGFYVCTVSNGVPDTHGQVNQSTDAFLSVQGKPVFIEGNKKIFYGIVNEPTYIRLEVYSVPKVTDIQLKDINGVIVNRQRDAVITDESALLRFKFHNTLVKVNGYQLKIHFSTFSQRDVGKYALDISNRYGKDTTNFTIQAASREEGMFTIFAVISSAAVVFIILLPAVLCSCIRNRCSGEVSGFRPRTIPTDGPSIYDEIPSDHIPDNFVPINTIESNDEVGIFTMPRIQVERQLETKSDVYISESEVYQVNDDHLEPWVKRQSVSDSLDSGSDVCALNTYYLHQNVKSQSESSSCNSGSDILKVNDDYLHPYVSLKPNWKEISKAEGLYMQHVK